MENLNYQFLQLANKEELPYANMTSQGFLMFIDKADGIVKLVNKDGVVTNFGDKSGIISGFTCNSKDALAAITTATAGTPKEGNGIQLDRWGVNEDITLYLKTTESELITIPEVTIDAEDNYGTFDIIFDKDMLAGLYNFTMALKTSTYEWTFDFAVTVTAIGD